MYNLRVETFLYECQMLSIFFIWVTEKGKNDNDNMGFYRTKYDT